MAVVVVVVVAVVAWAWSGEGLSRICLYFIIFILFRYQENKLIRQLIKNPISCYFLSDLVFVTNLYLSALRYKVLNERKRKKERQKERNPITFFKLIDAVKSSCPSNEISMLCLWFREFIFWKNLLVWFIFFLVLIHAVSFTNGCLRLLMSYSFKTSSSNK